MLVGIIGAGAMGAGIAQTAAMAGCEVKLFDVNSQACHHALLNIGESLAKFGKKGLIRPSDQVSVLGRIYVCEQLDSFSECNLVIEAVAEDISIKKQLFAKLESIVNVECILATNTSSLSVTSIASSLNFPHRFIGIHFFNPAVLMKLVEVIPAVQTDDITVLKAVSTVESWGKQVVKAKDTPGFIVNKVARPFYSEAIRILEEGIADIHEIDVVMNEQGFKMGPFTLMDFIGHDVNYKVTESVWRSYFYENKYRPSFTQLRLLEAGYLGRKSGKGFYSYPKDVDKNTIMPSEKANDIFMRIISMLINEAADTLYYNVCGENDVELAVCLGLNFPKGLIAWGEELGFTNVADHLDHLYGLYHEERYRVSPFLHVLAKRKATIK